MMRALCIQASMIALGLIAGCQADGKNSGAADPFALTPKRFLGSTLTVFMDGHQTRSVQDAQSPTWTVEPVDGNPTIRFLIDETAFSLPLKSVDIAIYPFDKGQVDEMVVYRPTQRLSEPDKEVRLRRFEYVGRGEYRSVSKLSSGRYRLVLHVIGQKNRDRQVILLTVK